MRTRMLALLLVAGLAGCANQTTVHLYAKYLSDEQTARFTRALEEREFHVKKNSLDFPADVESTTLLYSLLLKRSQDIDTLSAISKSNGFTIHNTRSLEYGNHWYTKNSVALFVMPASFNGLFKQDLFNTFHGNNCAPEARLTLQQDGRYILSGQHKDSDALQSAGTWHYRQPPYLELRADNATSFNYYTMSKFEKVDQISPIQMIKLEPLQGFKQIKECAFLFGQRISG